MGVLYLRRDGGDASQTAVGSNNQPVQDRQESKEPAVVNPLLIVIIVIGVLIIVTLAAFMALHCFKSRQKRRKELQRAKHWLEPRHAEDEERRMMICKSIASRSSLVMAATTMTTTANAPHIVTQAQPSPVAPKDNNNSNGNDSHGHSPATSSGTEELSGETTSLRDDWKAWEARMQTERRISTPGGVGLDQHPAFAAHLSAPQPTRMLSLPRIVDDDHYSSQYLGIPEPGANRGHWSHGSELQDGLVWGLNSLAHQSRPPTSS